MNYQCIRMRWIMNSLEYHNLLNQVWRVFQQENDWNVRLSQYRNGSPHKFNLLIPQKEIFKNL